MASGLETYDDHILRLSCLTHTIHGLWTERDADQKTET